MKFTLKARKTKSPRCINAPEWRGKAASRIMENGDSRTILCPVPLVRTVVSHAGGIYPEPASCFVTLCTGSPR